jgi:hypothetical protein
MYFNNFNRGIIMKEKAYPKYDGVRSGNKVSWLYYISKDKALEAESIMLI